MRRKTTSERLTRVAVNWWKADLEKHAAKYSALEASLVIRVWYYHVPRGRIVVSETQNASAATPVLVYVIKVHSNTNYGD